jgi:hypothetical protein
MPNEMTADVAEDAMERNGFMWLALHGLWLNDFATDTHTCAPARTGQYDKGRTDSRAFRGIWALRCA